MLQKVCCFGLPQMGNLQLPATTKAIQDSQSLYAIQGQAGQAGETSVLSTSNATDSRSVVILARPSCISLTFALNISWDIAYIPVRAPSKKQFQAAAALA